jgi:CRISPR/Cas system-associated protein Cas7 (RAMP superfamily)
MPKIKKKIIIKNPNYEAQIHCFKKGFRIYPVVSGNGFKIWYQLGHKGKYYMNGQEFSREESFQAIWDLYTKIYEHDKNN